MQNAQIFLVVLPVLVLLDTEVMESNAKKSTNALKIFIPVTSMPLVTILLVLTIAHVIVDGKVMVSPVSISMNAI